MSQAQLEDTETGVLAEARKLLTYTVEALLGKAVDVPGRQYVTAGQAVYDCEQVSATIASSQVGIPGATSALPGGAALANCPLPWQVIVDVAIVRCVPNMDDYGSPPPVGKLEAAAATHSADVDALQEAAQSRAAEQWGGVVCTITIPPPSGGMGATVGRYTVSITV